MVLEGWCNEVPAGESDGSMAGGVGVGIAGRLGMAATAIASMTKASVHAIYAPMARRSVSPGGASMGRSALVRLRTIRTREV